MELSHPNAEELGAPRVHIRVQRRDAPPEEVAELTDQLRRELLEAGADDVRRPQGEAAPRGAKGDPLAWAELVASFSGGLPALVALIRSWVFRGRDRAVVMDIDGDRLELRGVTAEQQDRLIEEWLERHPPPRTRDA